MAQTNDTQQNPNALSPAVYDFSRDALTPQANVSGMTPAQMSARAQQLSSQPTQMGSGNISSIQSTGTTTASTPTAPPVAASVPAPTVPLTPIPSGRSTITADVGTKDANSIADSLTKQQAALDAQQAARVAELEQEQKANERSINNVYANRQNTLESQQIEQQKTQDVLSYRLGRKDTMYGVAEMSNLKRDQALSMNQLATEQASLIQQSRAALSQGKFELANQFEDKARNLYQQTYQQQQLAFQKQTQMREEQKYVTEQGKDVFNAMALAGKKPSQELYDWYDSSIGVQGIGQSIFEAASMERQRKAITDAQAAKKADLDMATSVVNILDKIPLGESIKIGENVYTGMDRSDIPKGTETDNKGNVTYWELDKGTNQVKKTFIGNFPKDEDGWTTETDDSGKMWRINAKTGQQLPFYPSRAQENWQSIFPEGSVSPFLDAQGKPRTQCGAFVNDMTGLGVGDSFESKMAKMDLYKKGEGDPEAIINNLDVGDIFTQKLGTWTGHTGLVLGTETRNGVSGIRALESNFEPGKVTSTRFIPLSQIDGLAKAPKVHPSLRTGPDATRPTFGAKTTAATKALSFNELAEVNKGLPPEKRLALGATAADVTAAGYKPGQETTTQNLKLDEKQRSLIAKSADKKAIDSARGLMDSLERYKGLVQKYGFESYGKNKTALESAYADLKIKYKDAAGLGALTGPDVLILEEAIKPATGAGALLGKITAGGNAGIIKGIDDSISATQRGLLRSYDNLTSQYDNFTNDPYLKSLGKGVLIPVKDKESGQTGTIPADEMDTSKYERL